MNPDSPSIKPATSKPQLQLSKRLSAKRLWLPLLLQTGIILAVPAQAVYTQITGKTAILQTVAVAPYDPLRGYSQTLIYDISRVENLRRLPGWQELSQEQAGKQSNRGYVAAGTWLYVILAAPTSTTTAAPAAWQPVRVSGDRPTSLPANQVAIRGKSTGSSVEYGLETYYLPESQRQEINQDIQKQQDSQSSALVVEVKVNAQGQAVPISFWVSDRRYQF